MFLGHVSAKDAISPSIRHALCRMTPQAFQQTNKTTWLYGSESVNADQSEPSPYAESKCGTAANLMAKHLSLLTACASCFISCLFNTHQHWRPASHVTLKLWVVCNHGRVSGTLVHECRPALTAAQHFLFPQLPVSKALCSAWQERNLQYLYKSLNLLLSLSFGT